MHRLVTAILFTIVSFPAAAAVFTVSNTNDSGAGSLRQAIIEANATSEADVVRFSISGDGVHTIVPLSFLPSITKPLTIDGYTQPGAQPNSDLPDQGGLNGSLLIEISGIDAPYGVKVGLVVKDTDAILRGLVIHGFEQQINVGFPYPNTSNVTIEGCYLGTDPTGTVTGGTNQKYGIAGNSNHGLVIVGGATAAARNLISGVTTGAIALQALPIGPIVRGNLIGTDVTGMHTIASHGDGIIIGSGGGALNLGTRIGGDTAAARNVISGNGNGIAIVCFTVGDHACVDGLRIEGNYIGTAVDGFTPLPNTLNGINTSAASASMSHMRIGGDTALSENRIAWNGASGVFTNDGNSTWTVEIARNRIFGNGNADVDLSPHGRNHNDVDDGDETYDNRSQNYPEILAIGQVGNQLTISYRVDTAVAHATYPLTVRFYRAHGGGADLWLGDDTISVANAQLQNR